MMPRCRGGAADEDTDDSGDILGSYVELNSKRPAEVRRTRERMTAARNMLLAS